MKIDRKLHIVIPIEVEDGIVYVHAKAIGADIFDRFYKPIAKAHSAMYFDKLGPFSAPKVADKYLRDVSQELGIWEEVQRGLIAEIHRLTNVIRMTDKGWESVPYEEVRKKKLLEPEDLAQIEAALVFFTLGSAMYPARERRAIIDSAISLWNARTESLNSTDFMNSLATSTETENSGERTAA